MSTDRRHLSQNQKLSTTSRNVNLLTKRETPISMNGRKQQYNVNINGSSKKPNKKRASSQVKMQTTMSTLNEEIQNQLLLEHKYMIN